MTQVVTVCQIKILVPHMGKTSENSASRLGYRPLHQNWAKTKSLRALTML